MSPLIPPQSIASVYDPELFAHDAQRIVQRVHRYLVESLASQGPVVDGPSDPSKMLAQLSTSYPEGPVEALDPLLDQLFDRSVHLHHPRAFGYQVSSPIPRAALLSLVAAIVNAGMAAYDSGPIVTAMERRVIDWLLRVVGMPQGGGVLTSGGSLGNLTALLAAREHAFWSSETSARDEGNGALSLPLAILCSEQVHYSIERAAQIMGIGRVGVLRVRTDHKFRMIPSEIAVVAREAKLRGVVPIAIVASTGSTGTGAVDPLEAIADQAQSLGIWLHVDGAHGASALLSTQHRAALKGIERADSLVWDAHKLMAMPALCTAVLFKHARTPYATFAQDAAYLFQEQGEDPWHDIGLRTVECTKTLLAVPLHLCLSTFGTGLFSAIVDHAYALAHRFSAILKETDDFELACDPDSNIVCFRYVPEGMASDEAALNALQRKLRAQVRERGNFFIVLTTLRTQTAPEGTVWLRVSLMNPNTSESDLHALLAELRAVGA